ncbi:MAG: 3-hydroxyacyl-[acyl-carrier-protein] dehydratase FabA, partial [Psychrobium sp.]|nr:3-hydroxyacyl-[acyl-carrier-protein] dehydratase FabA [Psychrobium sp.]
MENIAVVGIANLFPGSSDTTQFWQQLLEQQDCRSVATAKQMGVEPSKYHGKKGDNDKFYCVHGGYINEFDFDPSGFNVDSDYLSKLDDLNQWALYVTKKALTNAGYWGAKARQECGVILGNLSFPTKSSNQLFMPLYHQVVDNALKQLLHKDFELSHYTEHKTTHADNALVAGYPAALIAKAAGLGGSHFALDAACASSCYSVKLACDYLHTGKANMMLAGAVSGSDPMFVNMGFSIFQAYPGNNIHAPFDKNSQGLFAGEGAGMMVLKRHSDAVRDGDTIHAIIKGGALSNDGKGEFVLSPNTKGQVLVYERAYENAGVDPSAVDYIECHATGTPKGDNVELRSMETFFSRVGNKPLLGSVKSNLGHLLTAAGMPGMTKAMMALEKGQIPATINLNEPLQSKNGYFTGEQMPTNTVEWPSVNNDTPRTAGVSVFGFGGSNAHLVLQQATKTLQTDFEQARAVQPLAIVGMDAHFGHASNLSQFKTLLDNNDNTFVSLPKQRWKGIEQDQSVMNALGLSQAPKGGYVENFDIDFLRFKVPPNDQDCLIPQQLMMMKVADNAAKDAALVEGSNVAVLVAMGMELELHQYRGRVNLSTQIEQSLIEQGIELTETQREQLTNIAKDGVAFAAQLNQYTSFIGNIMASRISALWDFSGPAITVSAEENSVYRCIELAQNLFQTSDVDAVIIASVDLAGSIENITLRQHYGQVDVHASSASDVLAKHSWNVGEGAAAIVLKPQSQVEANHSYASIDAIAFAPGSDAAAINKASDKALSLAGVNRDAITNVEAHASGFSTENDSERQAFAALYPRAFVGSVKTNIGHTFNASGIASIIKSALALDGATGNNLTAINGLGRDDCCAHLILSGNNTHYQKPALTNHVSVPVKKRPQLIKTISLGGQLMSQAIVNAQGDALNAIKQRFASGVKNRVSNPVQLTNLSPQNIDKIGLSTLNQVLPSTASIQPIEQNVAEINIAANVGVTVNISNKQNKQTNTHTDKQIQVTDRSLDQRAATHSAFLKNRQTAQQQLATLIEMQANVSAGRPAYVNYSAINAVATPTLSVVSSVAASTPSQLTSIEFKVQTSASVELAQSGFKIKGPVGYDYPPLVLKERYSQPENVIWDYEDLVEFAEGDIGKVFGAKYNIIDGYSRRVRLPTTDYLLVTRVTELDATINEYKKSYMCTEYDIPVDAPFLIDG